MYKKINLNFSYIINLGGYVDHKNKLKTLQSHYHGCRNLIDYFKNKKIKNFIQVGSSLEYGLSKAPNKEKAHCYPRGNYGMSKYKATKYLMKIGKKSSFPFTILRLYQIYGPNQGINRLIPLTIDACLKDKDFPCSNGQQYRDFLYVDDLVKLFLLVIKKKATNQIFNVGSGNPIKVKTVIKLIRSRIGFGYPIFGKIKMRDDEIRHSYPNIKKVKSIFSWKPSISLKKGMLKTINFYEQQKR